MTNNPKPTLHEAKTFRKNYQKIITNLNNIEEINKIDSLDSQLD